MVRDYNPWVHHEESVEETHKSVGNKEEDNHYCLREDMASLVFYNTNMRNSNIPQDGEDSVLNSEFESGADNAEVPSDFQKLMDAAYAELYLGCKTFKNLDFIITL